MFDKLHIFLGATVADAAARPLHWVYDEKNIPTKETINELLKKAWELTPSKQQYMPYTVNVIGPNDQAEKERIWRQAIKNHHRVEDEALADGYIKDSKHTINRNYQHIITAPYVFIFTSRVCESNAFNKLAIEESSHMPEQELPKILASLHSLHKSLMTIPLLVSMFGNEFYKLLLIHT